MDLDCHACRKQGKGRCSIPLVCDFEGETLKGCPQEWVRPFSYEALKWYGHYKNGFLPNLGTIAQQPHKLIMAFSILDAEFYKLREEQTKAKSKRPKSKGGW